MLTTLVLYCHLMLNPQFVGDEKQIEAVQKQIAQKYHTYTIKTKTYQDNDSKAPATLIQALSLAKSSPSIIIASGNHGYQFLTKAEIQQQITDKRAISLWVGHQDPGLIKHQHLFNIVALPIHIIEDKPELTHVFKNRLIAMEAVPNTLQVAELAPGLKKWNESYSNEAIPASENGYIGIFLGGPAPQPQEKHGVYLYETLEAIRQRGFLFGQMAKKENKKLLIANGPRTGKFYPESPDPTDPIIRQFNAKGWIPFAELTEEQRKITVNNLAKMTEEQKKTLAHTHASPLDPETQAFIQGIVKSGLANNYYNVFDFKATPGMPTKSAYIAIIAALYQTKDKSIACYSGESISYAEIGYFIPNTYAFVTGTMNTGHHHALKRFSQVLHMVKELNFNKEISEQTIDMAKKNRSIEKGSQQDAERIANALKTYLNLKPYTQSNTRVN